MYQDKDGNELDKPLPESAPQEDLVEDVYAMSASVTHGRKRKRAGDASSKRRKGKAKARDTWTRWPLLAGDVHVPEWGLEDEVKLFATTHLCSMSSASDHGHQPLVNDEDDVEDTGLPSSTINVLTSESADHLSRILALLAAHVPPGEKIMQNRVRPLGWEAVLDVVGASGLVDANIVQNVQRRLQTVYGPTSSNVVDRVQTTSSVEMRLDGVCFSHDLSFLTLSGFDPTSSLPKRKRGRYKKSS